MTPERIAYLEEHHHITESCIGLVKARLGRGDIVGAKRILKRFTTELDELNAKYQTGRQTND